MKDSVIIVSGGMDSITLLYDCQDQLGLAITFDYGSKHNAKEIPFAKMHCERLSIKHIVIPLQFVNDYFKSDLLQSGGEIPEGHYESENAESNGFNKILIGNHSGDHAIYPDCREEFITAMSEAIKNGTYENVEIFAPYTKISKLDIAKIGQKLNIDYSQTWTCYKGEDIHCGVCGSCVERKEALAGFDTTKYQH